jgi:chemotaxis protein methyltransferase CheR
MMNEYTLTDGNFRTIAQTLESCAGIALPASKRTLVYSRLVKRLRAVGVRSFSEYCDLVTRDKDEQRRMIEALTTNTTSFFREPHHFEHLKTELETHLAPVANSGGALRLWSAACSSGEEPYSIALTVLQTIPSARNLDIKILATDINSSVIERASNGVYGSDSLETVPLGIRKRFFEAAPESGQFSISPTARELIRFGILNLQGAWPMKGAFDCIFCRNVMIYFSPETQERLWLRFAKQLKSDGVLYIGHSERVTGPATELLTPAGPTTYVRFRGGLA